MDFNRAGFVGVAFLMLGACSQMFIKSTVVFEHTDNDTNLILQLESSVQERVLAVGGNCEFSRNGGGFLTCLTPNKMRVYTGLDGNGFVFFELNSGTTVVLPTSQAKFDRGYYLSEEHRDWENWFNSEFSGYEFIEKTRRTTGGIVQEF